MSNKDRNHSGLHNLTETELQTRDLKSFDERAARASSLFSLSLLFSFFFFLAYGFFRLSRAASVALLPSALFVERFSLGANWASSFQHD